MTLKEKDAYIANHLMKLEPDTLRYMVADLTVEVQRLEATANIDHHGWKTGFVCGYVCAAANVVRTHDLPVVALDLLKEGVSKEDMSVVDESDIETLANSCSRIAAYLGRDQTEAAEAVRP